jgi:hypothetical protein
MCSKITYLPVAGDIGEMNRTNTSIIPPYPSLLNLIISPVDLHLRAVAHAPKVVIGEVLESILPFSECVRYKAVGCANTV